MWNYSASAAGERKRCGYTPRLRVCSNLSRLFFFPLSVCCLYIGRAVSLEGLKKYLAEKVFPLLEGRPFCLVYVHTHVQRAENFPGISTLRSIYEALPMAVKENLETVYFVHPGLQARLFFATFGRFLFSGGYNSPTPFRPVNPTRSFAL